MIDWIKSLLCMHAYETDHKIKRYETNEDGSEDTKGYAYILRCKKCGRVTKRNVFL